MNGETYGDSKYEYLKRKRLFLLDMDGTIYLDDILFECSIDFLNYIREIGGKYVFLTNNSSKSVKDYVKKLRSLRIDVDESNFFTSSQATSLYLTENSKWNKIYVIGTKSFKNELIQKGINVTDEYGEDIDCLVVGFDTELTYSKLVDGCRLLFKGVDFIATNPDLVCPSSFGFIPDCGSICEVLRITTGRTPFYVGKPSKTMVDLVVSAIGYSKDETIVIGDRLYTDIACGINAGVTTAVVLTGETKREHLSNAKFVPDYVFEDIKHLYKVLVGSECSDKAANRLR